MIIYIFSTDIPGNWNLSICLKWSANTFMMLTAGTRCGYWLPFSALLTLQFLSVCLWNTLETHIAQFSFHCIVKGQIFNQTEASNRTSVEVWCQDTSGRFIGDSFMWTSCPFSSLLLKGGFRNTSCWASVVFALCLLASQSSDFILSPSNNSI